MNRVNKLMKTAFGAGVALAVLLLVSEPCLGERESSGPPAVFWASEPVLPGETVLLLGDGLASLKTIEMARIDDASPRRWVKCKPARTTGQALAVVIPEAWEPGVYAWRTGAANSHGTEHLLNRPDLWWVQGDGGTTASPGGWIRVFGKCLAFDGSKPRIILQGAKQKRVLQLVDEAVSPYSLKATIPADFVAGRCTLRVHSGLGGKRGWSDAIELNVGRKASWPDARFNVADFGAVGNDGKDDTEAVRKALEAAKGKSGGRVFFPRGRYRLSGNLHMPRFVVLTGAATDQVTLYWDDTEAPPEALIQGTDSFGVENLTIACANYVHVIMGNLGAEPDSGDVRIDHVRVRANIYFRKKKLDRIVERMTKTRAFGSSLGGDLIRVGGKNVRITDCDLYGSGRALFLSRVRAGYLARNTFYNGRFGWYSISGSDGLIFEHNRILGGDLMSTGGGLNTLDGSSYSRDVYFAHNVLQNFFGWDREAMTSDAGGGAYLGSVDSCDGSTLVLSKDPDWKHKKDWKLAGVFVLGGKGRGQYRRIVAYEGRRIALDRPWDVAPDATSEVSVTMFHHHYLIVGNTFRDATVAVQFYGNSIEHIVAQNRCIRAGGFHNFGMLYAGGTQPSWFVQYFDNEILEGNGLNGPLNEYPPKDSHLAVMGHRTPERKTPLARCTVMRRNHLHNNARIEVTGFCEDVLIERNVIEKTDVGITVEETAKGVLVRENHLLNVRREYKGSDPWSGQ